MIAPDDLGRIDTEEMTVVLGYEMQSRGKDATGILTVDRKGRWKLRKKPYPADVFLASRQGIGVSAQTLLLHTRQATQGKPSNPANNHPIQHGGIVGIHNGIIHNDDKLFAHFEWPRLAEVDSEAIFAALNYLPRDEALLQIDGSWATSWVDTDDDPRKLWIARGSSSPLHYALTENGSIVFASTHSAVKLAMKHGGINGDPDIKFAPEGFLGYGDPDQGGLVVLDKFDASGKTAIGARTNRVYVSNGAGGYCHGGYYGGTSWSYDGDSEEWMPTPKAGSTPVDGVRIWITGDPKSPKVNDRRRFFEKASNEWIYEICTSTMPQCWVRISESKAERVERVITPIGSSTVDEKIEAARAKWKREDDQRAREAGKAGSPGGESLAELVKPKEVVVDPFDLEGCETGTIEPVELAELVDDDTRLGFAGVGDLIAIPKDLIEFHPAESDERYTGAIVGEVIDFDENTKELIVDWRRGRLSLFAEYEVMLPSHERR